MTARNTDRIAVVVVNYNTAEAASHLLFSLFRVVGRKRLARVIVVDNGSSDESVPLLKGLVAAGLIEGVFNRRQQYHGPALNQALDYLAARKRLAVKEESDFDAVWALDSDTIVLRQDIVPKALAAMRKTGAALLGEFQYDALPQGYAHPCALFLDLQKIFLTRCSRFDDSGAPATRLHVDLRERGIPICHFPILAQQYVLHIGRGTRRAIHQRGETANRHFRGQTSEPEPHYHGNPQGAEIHRAFLEKFSAEVEAITPQRLTAACLREQALAPIP